MKRQVLLFAFLFLTVLQSIGQDVLKPFDLSGCPTDSVRLVIKDQYSLAKFIVNFGEKEIWGSSYVTHYNDLEHITVRGFYEDLTEDITSYELGMDLEDCGNLFMESSACYGSVISKIVPPEFDAIDIKLQGVIGVDDTYVTYDSGEVIDFEIGKDEVLIDYTVKRSGYTDANHSASIEAKIVDIESGLFCPGETVTIRSCRNNSNTQFKEISGIAGNNDGVGSEYSFIMRQSNVVIEVYDPDLNWTKQIILNFGVNKIVNYISDINLSCDGAEITFHEDDQYNIKIYDSDYFLNFGEEYGVDYFGWEYLPIGYFYSYEPVKLVDTVIHGNSFYFESSYDWFNTTVLVQLEDSNCADYDARHMAYEQLDEAIHSTLPSNLFATRIVGESVSDEFLVSEWKVYNHFNINTISSFSGTVTYLVAEGTTNAIEFENFSKNGTLEITLNENGLCRKYYKSYTGYENGSSAEPILNPTIDRKDICVGDTEVITAVDGRNFLFVDEDFNMTITDSLLYTHDAKGGRRFVAQFNKAEELWLFANKLFDNNEFYCVGEQVQIGLCTDLIDVSWDLTGLEEVGLAYQFENDVLTFNMPNFSFEFSGIYISENGNVINSPQIIKPNQNGFNPGIIEANEIDFCHVIEIPLAQQFAEVNWYVNDELVSTEDDLTYYLSDYNNLGADLTVRLEVITDGGCDFFDEVDINYVPTVNEAILFPIDNSALYCPSDMVTLICPESFAACRWILNTGESIGNEYSGFVGDVLEVQGISADGCITRQVLDYNIVIADTPLQICQVAGEPLTDSNVLFWESDDDYEMIYVYREENFLGDYQLIDSLQGFETQYIDNTASANIRSYRYKLQYRDICNNRSNLDDTPHHKTINLAANVGVNNVVNLAWNDYEGIDYLQVNILRGTDINSMESIATLPKGINAFIDSDPIVSDEVIYTIEVVLGESCVTALPLISNTVVTQLVSSVADSSKDSNISLYPNPTTGQIAIHSDKLIKRIDLYNLDGRILQSNEVQSMQSSLMLDVMPGVYFVRLLIDDDTFVVRRVVVSQE